MSYDEKCRELAEHFLCDLSQTEQPMTRDRLIDLTERLAAAIQTTVEDFIAVEGGAQPEPAYRLTEEGRAALDKTRGAA